MEYSDTILQIVNRKEALRCWTRGFLHPLLHLVKGGVAVDGTVLLHADAAELVGKGKVLAKTGPAQFFQLVPPVVSTARTFRQGAKPWAVRV